MAAKNNRFMTSHVRLPADLYVRLQRIAMDEERPISKQAKVYIEQGVRRAEALIETGEAA